MKCLIQAALVLLLASAFLGCARKPLTPATPWTDIVDDSLWFLATTTDPGGSGLEYTFDWGDGQTFATRRYQSGETAYARHAFADNLWHEVKVQARNENGRWSPWSPSLRFRRSNPPVISDDTISGPVRWAVNRRYHASVVVSDPDGDSVSVKFIWDGDEGGTWTEFSPSGSTFTDSCLWTATGPHTLKVVARDKGNMVARPKSTKTVNVSGMAVIWTNDEMDVDASPALGRAGGEVVVCVVSEPGVWAINADGTTRWKWDSRPMSAHSGPSTSADGTRLYVADDNRGVLCFDVATGALLWQLAEQHGDCTPVVGPGGVIYVTSWHTLTLIRDLGSTAAIGWELNSLRQYTNVVIGENGVIYGVSYGSWEPCPAGLRPGLRRKTALAGHIPRDRPLWGPDDLSGAG